MNRQPWTPEEEAFLRAHYENTPTKTLAEHLGRTLFKVYAKANNLGLSKSKEYYENPLNCGRLRKGSNIGADNRFRKGNVPANKGLRRPGWSPGRMKETQFKHGQRTGIAAKNWVPIGTIKVDTEGFLRIKVREAKHGKEATGFGNTKVWPLLNRHVWEQHKGPIPDGHIVKFKDKDRNNCAIENLELLSMADNMRLNSLWATMPRELAEVIQLSGALTRQLRNREKHAKE